MKKCFMSQQISSKAEYISCVEQNQNVINLANILNEEFKKSGQKTLFKKGFCSLCKEEVDLFYDLESSDLENINFRERLWCPKCYSSNRMRASFSIIDEITGDKTGLNIYCQEQVTLFFQQIQKLYGKTSTVTGSEFFGFDVPGGKIIDGIRSENALDLSFEDNSFDIIISNDVYEHIPDIEKAFSEAYRTLKTGGYLVYTVPFSAGLDKSELRAKIENGDVVLLKEKQIHGNPMSKEGSLVFYDFGWDILSMQKDIGYSEAYGVPFLDEEYGYINYLPTLVFVAKK